MLDPGDRVLVAVSGGPDSVALARGLVTLQRAGDPCPFEVVALAHFNHRLRGAESDADERFCGDLARDLGIAFERGEADVATAARVAHRSREDAARRLRYAFLRKAAHRVRATRIAVGHTRNDQAETVLLRILRGAGPRGLAGIFPVVDPPGGEGARIIRPLLEVGRDEILAWLESIEGSYRVDASNADRGIPRNRIRHELLPYLSDAFNPAIVETMARMAEIVREEDRYLDGLTAAVEPKVVEAVEQGVRIRREALLRQPLPIERRVLRRAFARLAAGAPDGERESETGEPSTRVGFDQLDRLLEAVGAGRKDRIDVGGGIEADLDAKGLVLRRDARIETAAASYQYVLDVPGEALIPEAACRIVAQRRPLTGGDLARAAEDPRRALLDAARLGAGLLVRSWRAGDRFRPVGLGGSKKLQDFFVDRKVARRERDRTPVVALRAPAAAAPGAPPAEPTCELVWIAGYAVDDRYKLTESTTEVVELALLQN